MGRIVGSAMTLAVIDREAEQSPFDVNGVAIAVSLSPWAHPDLRMRETIGARHVVERFHFEPEVLQARGGVLFVQHGNR